MKNIEQWLYVRELTQKDKRGRPMHLQQNNKTGEYRSVCA